jgi:hypothetical protein
METKQGMLEGDVKLLLQWMYPAVLIADRNRAGRGGFRLVSCDTRGVCRDVTHEFDPL